MHKRIVVGLFAHVDAGKTTLAERLLYMSGAVKDFGRVDRGEAFLDTDSFEKERGITMYSKQARFIYKDTEYVLVDTPGHSDLTPETERALWVTDCAVLLISASEGITSHTRRLWKMLDNYHIPVFIFVNKTDMPGVDKEALFADIKDKLSSSCAVFTPEDPDPFYEEASLTDEKMLESYLEGVIPDDADIARSIFERKFFPCCFGSALTGDGAEGLIECMYRFSAIPEYGDEFGARIYKISRDTRGARLVWMKLTGGTLRIKDVIDDKDKADEIRIYSGENYTQVNSVQAGDICTVKGLRGFRAGDCIGHGGSSPGHMSVPVLSYDVICSDILKERELSGALQMLAEEDPLLMPYETGEAGRISVHVSGQIQLDIIKHALSERFGIDVSFREQEVVYRETISNRVVGAGHFEPLRHYAEVQLLLEPAEKGSGVIIGNSCSRDDLEPHWQKLIISHLYEKKFKGVLTGAELTDIRITLLKGRAHLKHTESGDFRQAVFRAVRQGLMEADSILLEPVVKFELEVPEENIGRAMSDLISFGAKTGPMEINVGNAVITGTCPVSSIRNYQSEVTSYTSGHGGLTMEFDGYAPCENAEKIIEESGYDPDRDTDEPSSSVFCSHGAGIIVPWYEVKERMHTEEEILPESDDSCLEDDDFYQSQHYEKHIPDSELSFAEREARAAAGELELQEIFSKTYKKTEKRAPKYRKKKVDVRGIGDGSHSNNRKRAASQKEEMLIVDGYNIIFASPELKKLAGENIDSARDQLMDMLSDYHGTGRGKLLVVFDAYKVKGTAGEKSTYHNIQVVYTKEGETADQFIERTVNTKGGTHKITVATSDRLEQTVVMGNGASRMAASELLKEIKDKKEEIRKEYSPDRIKDRVNMLDGISEDVKKELEGLDG